MINVLYLFFARFMEAFGVVSGAMFGLLVVGKAMQRTGKQDEKR